MAVFIGNSLGNIANAATGTLIGFVGGTLAQLQDAIGDTIVGLDGNDTIVAGNGNDVINGGDGNDFIDGRFGLDVMDGGAGIDTMDVSFFGGAYIWDMSTGITNFSDAGEFAFNFENAITGAGADRITGNAADNSISLGAGNDTTNGGLGNDSLFGGDGNDFIDGNFGLDLMNGGAGIDTMDVSFFGGAYIWDMSTGVTNFAGESAFNFENAITGAGADRITGNAADNSISLGAGNDTTNGGLGNDSLFGGDGNDFIDGNFGLDLMNGGAGIDTMDVSFFGGAYIWDMSTGVTNFAGESAFNFENAITGAGADRITGNAADNSISLGAGNDTANGGLGNDSLFGGDGNDFIDGNFGLDLMNGGTGIDTMDVSFFGGAYIWDMSTGVTNFAGESALNFENAITGAGADRITGNAANNSISLGAGNDTATGAAGNDLLLGGAGLDNLNGSFDNDRLAGGINNDTLIGGAGLDRFRFDTAPNSLSNFDRILDFSSPSDTMELENAIYAALPAGPLAAAAFKINGPLDPTDRIIYTPASGNIFYDSDGSGAALSVRFAQVNPGTVVDFTDFFVT